MAEANRKPAEELDSNVGLEGFDQFFDEQGQRAPGDAGTATTSGEVNVTGQMDKVLERFTELISLSVDQRLESAKMATQLIDNQRQLIATQQILIRLMDRSIELTRHIASIEERLPVLFELPKIVESLRDRIAQIEGVETE